MISVITINYNNKEGLERTIQSVVSQTNTSFEYIVVDGNSNDGSKDIIEAYKSQITCAIIEPDTGIYNAMNKGIRVATGDYLLFLNSGDVLYNNSVFEKIAPKIKTGVDIYYGNLVYESEGKHHLAEFPKKLSFSFFYKKSLPHPASFIRRDLFDRVFFYNESLRIVSDWEFFMCAICKFNATYEHLDLVVSDFEAVGISCDPKNKTWIEEERARVLKKHFPLFIEDSEELLYTRAKLSTNLFKNLLSVEKSKIGKKMTSIFLRVLTNFCK